jgi:hypothetical protein
MATEEDVLKTEQHALIRLARGTVELINEVGVTIAAGDTLTYPTDPIDVTNHKRIIGRLSHNVTMTAGKVAIEFSDEEAFTDITFFESLDLNITTNPVHTKVGATATADESVYCADFDIESMDKYMRAKVRNDTTTTVTFSLNARAKVM